MTIFEVVEYCRKTGIEMTLERGLLFCRPRALVSDELALAIHQHKPALLALLRRRRATDVYPLNEVWIDWKTYQTWHSARPSQATQEKKRSHSDAA